MAWLGFVPANLICFVQQLLIVSGESFSFLRLLCNFGSIRVAYFQGSSDGYTHLLIDGIESNGALDEAVYTALVVTNPAGAIAGRDAREDQHRLAYIIFCQAFKLRSLLLSENYLEFHSLLRILSCIKHLKDTPRPTKKV